MTVYPEPYYEFLWLLARMKQPGLTVELGTREGWGALALAEGSRSRVVTIDINPDAYRSECAHDLVERRTHDSLQVDPDLLGIDLLFIDTDRKGVHYGTRAEEEFNAWRPRLSPEGIVVFDDVLINQDMREWWETFRPLWGQKLTLDVHGGCGMGLVI